MRAHTPLITAAALTAMLGVAALAWLIAGATEVITADRIRQGLAEVRANPWAPLMVLALFLIAGIVAFPIHALVLATAAVFGPWLGFAYSAIGSFACALAPYFAGAYLGKETLARIFGYKLQRVLNAVRRRGVLVVVGFRLVPVAPGTIVNLALGASGIRFTDFTIGSIVGMLPGLVLISITGDRIVSVINDPTASKFGLLALCILGYLTLVFGAQHLLTRSRQQQ